MVFCILGLRRGEHRHIKSLKLNLIRLKPWHGFNHKYDDVYTDPRCMWCKHLEFKVGSRNCLCLLHGYEINKTHRKCSYSAGTGKYVKGTGIAAYMRKPERFPYSYFEAIDNIEFNRRAGLMIARQIETNNRSDKAKARRLKYYHKKKGKEGV